MSVLISQSSPTIRALHQTFGPGQAARLPNRPFNAEGELYATGGGVAFGWSGPYIDRDGGLLVNVGNAQYLDGANVIRLWNHSKDRTRAIELPVRPIWRSAGGKSEPLVSVYMSPAEVLELGFVSGDTLALQSRPQGCDARLNPITLAPVFLESQVLPHLASGPVARVG